MSAVAERRRGLAGRAVGRASLALLALLAGCAGAVWPASGSVAGALRPDAPGQWHRPVRLTRGPEPEFNADLCAAGGLMAYVSDSAGNADIRLQPYPAAPVARARRPAPHSARDMWPRISPDGRRLVFVSTRSDAAGDLYLLGLRGWPFARGLARLTDRASADDQPCWSPDGRRIFYVAAPHPGGPFDLWEIRPGGRPSRLTTKGAQMPDCSPDGSYLAFVSTRAAGDPDLWIMRLADGALARLTAGPALDLEPCWSSDGRRIFFTRIDSDTNGDGVVDRRDGSCICSVAFRADVFDGSPPGPIRQLTSGAFHDRFPRPAPGGFAFTRILSDSNADIFALGESGEAPDFLTLSGYVEFARRVERDEADYPFRRALAWQNACWAALTAMSGQGGISFDLPRRQDAAAAWLGWGRALIELGRLQLARAALGDLLERFPDARLEAAEAEVALLGIERMELLDAGASTAEEQEARWGAQARKARELLARVAALAARARGSGEDALADAFDAVCARARLEAGYAGLARRDYESALDEFGKVLDAYSDASGPAADALLATARVYRLLGQSGAARQTLLRLLRTYPDQEPQADRGAEELVRAALQEAEGPERQVAALRELADTYADLPRLAALAQNRMGDLYYARGEREAAARAYRRTVERFPAAASELVRARLALGRTLAEQGDYDGAAAAFGPLISGAEHSGGRARELAVRGHRRALLLKARAALDLGDAALALDTYARLLDFDPTLVAAHRGLVTCYARLGRIADAVARYEPRVRSDPDDHLAHYALALAYSYYGPEDWVGDRSATRRRAALDREALRLLGGAIAGAPDVAYYYQLRGFLLNRLAVATGEAAYGVRALDAYLTALGLSERADDPANYAALLFDVGEGYMLVEQPQSAYDYYRRALRAGFSAAGPGRMTALLHISRAATAASDYALATELLDEALSALDEVPRSVERARREAEILDRLALARSLDGDHSGAAALYERYSAVLERLIRRDSKFADAYRRNLLRARRNRAVNLFLAYRAGDATQADLRAAYALLEGLAREVDSVGIVRWQRAGRPGLFTVSVEIAPGREGGPRRFDVAAEKRLLYTYMARIKALTGDYAGAVRYLRRKLELYGKNPPADELVEQAVALTQIGAYEMALGSPQAAVEAYRKAAELEARAGDLTGEATAAVSFGRAVLWLARADPGAQGLQKALEEALSTHRALLGAMRAETDFYLVPQQAALDANLAALLAVRRAPQGP